jgi:hypothetical protein
VLEGHVIFVVEGDTQNGADHVDGRRSIFLACRKRDARYVTLARCGRHGLIGRHGELIARAECP